MSEVVKRRTDMGSFKLKTQQITEVGELRRELMLALRNAYTKTLDVSRDDSKDAVSTMMIEPQPAPEGYSGF